MTNETIRWAGIRLTEAKAVLEAIGKETPFDDDGDHLVRDAIQSIDGILFRMSAIQGGQR